ncbi:hypothetical protein HHL22_10050 [Hymenobacter sp. RP-2-7]|uniref:Uncharacterized protein n=1 Tax=Hymenobacter polaris TaxID=2682546 RepID=A0A7Y0ADT9_9BACT|nr:hypothetical protein [Hymenobacter polaris]NML65546.1 hypothetical protein [Hymenobacter polaris]
MKLTFSTTILYVVATSAFGQRVLSTNPLAIEDYKTIEKFTLEVTRLNLEIEPHGFSKKVQQLGEGERFVTFASSGNTIKYYKTGNAKVGGKQFIYSCKFTNAAAIASLIPFLLQEKSALIPKKYRASNKIKIEDTAGFYELDITFSGNKINQIIYTTHPD